MYVPVAPLLLEMLQWSELKRTPSGGAGAPPDMLLLLRLSKTQLKMASLQEDVIHQVRAVDMKQQGQSGKTLAFAAILLCSCAVSEQIARLGSCLASSVPCIVML